MADSTIGGLPAASALEDPSLLVVEQRGAAMNLTGLLLKQYVQSAIQPQVDAAEASADAAASSATAASNSATAAAQSAEEAKTATKWPYDGTYKGYLYKRLDSADPYTTTTMEFLIAPQENGELYRVSGRIPKRASFNDTTLKGYHYEKILKITGNVAGTQITFSGDFVPSIDGLKIAEAEPIGLVLFRTSDQSFYKYSSLPLININSPGQLSIDSRGFEIPDDYAANIVVSLQNEDLSPSDVTAYLYVRMKYTS